MSKQLRLCLEAVQTLNDDDVGALTDRIETYRARGMDDRASERAAVEDLIAQAEADGTELTAHLREQHPDAFTEAPERENGPLPLPEGDFEQLMAGLPDDGFNNPFVPPKETVRAEAAADSVGFISPEAAAAKLEEWRAHARAQGESGVNAGRVVISMFDASGEWSKPWHEAGYDVFQFDIQHGEDIANWDASRLTADFDISDVWALLAAPPCTDFASSGAQWWKAKDEDGRTEASKHLVGQTLATVELLKPAVWVLENPVGRIQKLTSLPKPRMTFQPHNFGDPYTKRTLLWGDFGTDLPLANVDPVEGSKMHRMSSSDKYGRSLTPEGFAYAFFMANNAHDMGLAKALAREFRGVDEQLLQQAVAAGHTEAQIRDAISDPFYDGDQQATEEGLRELLPQPDTTTADTIEGTGETPAPGQRETPPSNDDIIATIKPGKELTPEQRAAVDARHAARAAAEKAQHEAMQAQLDRGDPVEGDDPTVHWSDSRDAMQPGDHRRYLIETPKGVVQVDLHFAAYAGGRLAAELHGLSISETGYRSMIHETRNETGAEPYALAQRLVEQQQAEQAAKGQPKPKAKRKPAAKKEAAPAEQPAPATEATGPAKGGVRSVADIERDIQSLDLAVARAVQPKLNNLKPKSYSSGAQWADKTKTGGQARTMLQNEEKAKRKGQYDKLQRELENAQRVGKPAELPDSVQADIPKPVRDRVRIALGRLRDIEQNLADVERARGRGHVLALVLGDHQSNIDAARAKLAEFRRLAADKGIDSEKLITELGGEPDLERFNVTPVVGALPALARANLGAAVTPQVPPLGAKAGPTAAAAGDSAAVRQAKQDLMDSLGDLGNLLSKGTRSNMMPEEEQRLLPILTRVFDAAFRLGHLTFKQAARFVLDTIRSHLGPDVADQITLDHLQGAYIGMAGRYREQGADRAAVVAAVESMDEIADPADNAPEDAADVPSTDPSLERDRQDAGDQAPAVDDLVQPESGPAVASTGGPGEPAFGPEGRQPNDQGLPAGGSAAAGERGDQQVPAGDQPAGPARLDAGADDDPRGGGLGDDGVQPDADAAGQAAPAADRGLQDASRRQQQRDADRHPVTPGNLASVKATLPYLLPGQQEDVQKAETRFGKPDGYGMLFTNGTGTGKTFTGLGIVKRFARQGKQNTLIVVPSDKIAEDWITSGQALGLDITQLSSTKEAGRGIVITTYANLGQNDELAKRAWDLVVSDEAHYLMQEAEGTTTRALSNLRAITLHPGGASQRAYMLHRDLHEKAGAASSEAELARKSDDERDWARVPALEQAASKAWAAYNAKADEVKADVAQRQGAARPRAVFLSFTPFAYDKTIDWAQGYLFDYGEGQTGENHASGSGYGHGYNSGDWREKFFMQHLGYRMRTNKLTEPDAKVDRGLLRRQFNTFLKSRGVLSGRMLDVDKDYDRRFVLIDSAIGHQIDAALEWLRDHTVPGRSALGDAINERFDYLSRRYLLEAIKAEEAAPIIRQHLALGRKVVVFHDYKKGGGFHPFQITLGPDAAADVYVGGKYEKVQLGPIYEEFKARFPELMAYPFSSMRSPIETFQAEFPGVLLFNGNVSPKERRAAVAHFQADDSGPQLILVQSQAGKEGISLHDTTGKHQRVLINLGQPTQPTTAMQQEGRIYRTGQASNAIIRYLNTGTSWERWAFATTIAQRSSAAEDLGSGELARALKDSFIREFEASDSYPPGHEGEGIGGKEADKAANAAISEYDRAKAYYFGTQKKTQRNKAAEGVDYFATPEPIGLKMVEWLGLRPGEAGLEPSAGHGAIARWFNDGIKRTSIEPSPQLSARLALVFDGEIKTHPFEDLHVVNKYDGIAMNPPFGTAGRTAIDHLAKAATHLRDGGRIVALIPTGPSADAKFDKWFHEEDTKPLKPLVDMDRFGAVFKGDTLHLQGHDLAKNGSAVVIGKSEGRDGYVVGKFSDGSTMVIGHAIIKSVEPTGKRTESFSPAAGLHLVADIKLPAIAFERAAAKVMTRIVVLEKPGEFGNAPQQISRDYSDVQNINELFDRLEHVGLDPRAKPAEAPAEVLAAGVDTARGQKEQAKADKAAAQAQGARQAEAQGMHLVEHTTAKGKLLKGVVRKDLTADQAKAIDAYTFRKDGGYFIRAEHIPALLKAHPPADGPLLSRSGNQQTQPFYSALAREVGRSQMNAGAAGAWRQALKGMVAAGKVKADELAWTGVEEWLDIQPGKVTRAEVQAFLAANGVHVSETVLRNAQDQEEALNTTLDGTGYRAERDPFGDGAMLFEDENNPDSEPLYLDELPEHVRDLISAVAAEETRYEQYTLPGGENYREVLLTLPSKPETVDVPAGRGPYEARQNEGKWFIVDRYGEWGEQGYPSRQAAEAAFPAPRKLRIVRDPAALYQSSHWDQPNVLAHIRVNDRTDAEGKRVLFVEEIQSDWGQEGKKKGFYDKAKPFEVFNVQTGETVASFAGQREAAMDAVARGNMFDYKDESKGGKLPPAPFVGKTDAWVALAIKRVVKMAVDEGYDRVAFVNGEQSAERYDLSKRVQLVRLVTDDRDGTLRRAIFNAVESDSGRAVNRFINTASDLEDVIGKDLAKKLMDQPPTKANGGGWARELSGLDLKVGGEGMKAFYDQIVPAVAKDVLRKMGGGQMTEVPVRAQREISTNIDDGAGGVVKRKENTGATLQHPGFDITPAMREKAAAGVPLFKKGDGLAGLPLETATAIASKLAAAGVHINVAPTIDDMPPDLKGALLARDPSGEARGVYFPGSDAVWLIASNLSGPDEMVFVTLHEAFHRGLHITFGEQGAQLLRQLYAANKRVRDLADDQMRRFGIGKEEAVNEALADLAGAGEAEALQGWQKLVRMVREWVAKIAKAAGIDLPWTDARVRDLVASLTRAGLKGEPSVNLAPATAGALASRGNSAFARWFGASKIVDAQGKPRVMYHGTGQDIDSFIPKQAGAIFVTDEPIFAQAYADTSAKWMEYHGQEGAANIVPVYVKAENPFDFDNRAHVDSVRAQLDHDGLWKTMGELDSQLKEADNWSFLESGPMQEAIKAAGFDGFYVKEGSFKNLGVYHPTQLKSAVGNSGAYDPEDHSLVLSRAGKPKHTPEELAALAKAGQSPSRTMKQSVMAGWGGMVELLRDRGLLAQHARQNALDQFYGIQRALQRDVANLPAEQDHYVTARLANGGTSSVMRGLLLHGQARWAPGGQHLEKIPGTKGLLDILKPLGEDLPDFFGWMVGNRAARLLAEGREKNLKPDDIKALQGLAKTPEQLALFKATAKEYAAFKRSVLDVAEAAGLIDADGRKAWDHADYIPFYRQVDDKAMFSATGRKGLAGQSSGIRTLRGGEAALNDPLENLLMNFSRLIDASLKNNALDKTVSVLERAGSPALKKVGYDMKPAIVPRSEIERELERTGVPEDLMDLMPPEAFDGMAKLWAIQPPQDPDVIRIMRGGKPVFYRVADPLLLKAATSFVPFDFPGLGLARMFKRVLTGTVTATPEFMLRNFIRDSVATQGIAQDGINPVKSLTGIVRAFKEDGAAEAMLFAGASFQGGNIGGHDPTTTARAIRRALRQKGLDATAVESFMGTVVDTTARGWELYRALGESVENANREAVFEATMKARLKAGASQTEATTAAAFEAKDLMDFSLRGSHPIYQLAADVLPFFNARVQGLYRMGRADPKRLAIYGAIMATLSVALVMANAGLPWYEELPDWDKDGYWHMRIGGRHFRIPKPFELGVAFATVPERIARYLAGTDSAKKFGGRLWANIRDQLAFDPVPQIFRPAANVWANKDTFRDAPIESAADEGKLPHMRYSGNTSATARSITRGLAPVTDELGLSPKKLEYLVGGYLGTAGTYALGLSDMAVRAIEGYPDRPAMRLDDLPIVRAFVREDPARSTVYESDLYKVREKVDQVYRSITDAARKGDVATARQLLKDYPKELAARGVVDGATKGLAGFRKQQDMIIADTEMTPEQKRQAIDKVQEQKNELARRAVKSPAVQALQ